MMMHSYRNEWSTYSTVPLLYTGRNPPISILIFVGSKPSDNDDEDILLETIEIRYFVNTWLNVNKIIKELEEIYMVSKWKGNVIDYNLQYRIISYDEFIFHLSQRHFGTVTTFRTAKMHVNKYGVFIIIFDIVTDGKNLIWHCTLTTFFNLPFT